MSSLWEVSGSNRDQGEWRAFVRCKDPVEAVRAASEKHPWDILAGIKVKAILDFIEVPTPSPTERNEG